MTATSDFPLASPSDSPSGKPAENTRNPNHMTPRMLQQLEIQELVTHLPCSGSSQAETVAECVIIS